MTLAKDTLAPLVPLGKPEAMNEEGRRDEEENGREGAEADEQEAEQDKGEASAFDTEEHSDAPGPFGTG
jgi:hypothetical protein